MYAIKCKYNYLPGTFGAPEDEWMSTDLGNSSVRLPFNTHKEAENFLREYGMAEYKGCWYRPGTYYLNYGEQDRPEYFIRHVRAGKVTPEKVVKRFIDEWKSCREQPDWFDLPEILASQQLMTEVTSL